MRLSRDQILKADDLATEEVAVPEWPGDDGEPGTVLVRGLTGKERDSFEDSLYQQRGRQMVRNAANIRAKLVIRCVIGDDGEPLFGPEDIPVLGEKSGAALDRLWEVASRLSGMNEDDIEAMEGNSGAAPRGDSTSGLPQISGARSRNSSPGSRQRN